MSKRIDVVDQAIPVLLALKTQKLNEALDEQHKALVGLIQVVQEYQDWIAEQIVRLNGEA